MSYMNITLSNYKYSFRAKSAIANEVLGSGSVGKYLLFKPKGRRPQNLDRAGDHTQEAETRVPWSKLTC